MRVVLARPAKAARNHAVAQLADDPLAAARLYGRFEAAQRRLGQFPSLGRAGAREGIRELVVDRTPYVFVYQIEANAVVILDIRHTSRRPS